jgi:ubiquinone/menaquinone biosynthesis C-methylase UbiE
MGFYNRVVLPRICDLAMRTKQLVPYRERIIHAAEGRILEIGAGSGLNLPLYGAAAKEVLALEPDPQLVRMAEKNAERASPRVHLLEASAEEIPLDDSSIDTVVSTWTLCTIPDADRALREMRRVLKPGGRFLFVEHGLAPELKVQKWQRRLTPYWERISGGCHLTREIDRIVRDAGFVLERLDTGYLPGGRLPGPNLLSFQYEGSAHAS